MPARACGTIRIARASVISTTSAITPRTISVAICAPTLSFGDERGGAVDLHDLDPRTRLERVVLVVGPRGPNLSPDLHAAAIGIHALDHGGGPAHERGGAGSGPPRGGPKGPRRRPPHSG